MGGPSSETKGTQAYPTEAHAAAPGSPSSHAVASTSAVAAPAARADLRATVPDPGAGRRTVLPGPEPPAARADAAEEAACHSAVATGLAIAGAGHQSSATRQTAEATECTPLTHPASNTGSTCAAPIRHSPNPELPCASFTDTGATSCTAKHAATPRKIAAAELSRAGRPDTSTDTSRPACAQTRPAAPRAADSVAATQEKPMAKPPPKDVVALAISALAAAVAIACAVTRAIARAELAEPVAIARPLDAD